LSIIRIGKKENTQIQNGYFIPTFSNEQIFKNNIYHFSKENKTNNSFLKVSHRTLKNKNQLFTLSS